MAGVKDMAKVVLSEVPGSKERKLEKMRKEHGAMKASEAVARIRAEVNKLAEKVGVGIILFSARDCMICERSSWCMM